MRRAGWSVGIGLALAAAPGYSQGPGAGGKLNPFGIFDVFGVGYKNAPPAKHVRTTTGNNNGEMIVAGHLVLAESLTDAARGIREVYLRLYMPGGTVPLGYVKCSVAEDAKGSFLDFKIYESQVVWRNNTGIPTTFDVGAKLNRYGLGDMDVVGDLTGLVRNVKFSDANTEITIDQRH